MNEESHSQALEDRPWFDWYRWNSIKPDRFKPTIFQSELSQLELDETKRYVVLET